MEASDLLSSTVNGVPETAAPKPLVRAFKMYNGKEYRLTTNSQAIATEILSMPEGKQLEIAAIMLDPSRCDLTELFNNGGYIASPKDIK